MNSSSLFLAQRGTSTICLACRQVLLRQKSRPLSAPRFASSFQSYPLNPQRPSQPRNAVVPDSSIAHNVDVTLPKVHETRPPKRLPEGAGGGTRTPASIPEREAQESRHSFLDPAVSDARVELGTGSASSTSAIQNRSRAAQTDQAPSARARQSPGTTSTGSTKPAPRASRLRTPRKAALKLTPAAVSQLRALLSAPDPKLIRVGVRNRGCSGLAYHLEYVEHPGAFDETVEQDGVRVLIDSKALFSIIGSEMDWVEDKLSQRFVFRNPNIKEQCGCGESFMV